jgi:hypothetical protein
MAYPTDLPASFNSIPATNAHIMEMEELAGRLLDTVPAEHLRQYGHTTISGSIALFLTASSEQSPQLAPVAVVKIAEDYVDEVALELVLGHDNMPITPLTITQDREGDIIAIIQDLLDDDVAPVEPVGRAILRHMQACVMDTMVGVKPKPTHVLPKNDRPLGFKFIADAIRSEVDKNVGVSIMEKLWSYPLGNNDELWVVSNDLVGDAPADVTIAKAPYLRISYEDMGQNITRLFTRQFDGEATLKVSVNGANLSSEEPVSEEGERQIAAFASELDDTVPSKNDVDLLSAKITQALEMGI